MKKARFHPIAGLLVLGLEFSASFAQAQAGTLDTTFGTGGTVTASLGVTATTLTAFEQSNDNIAVIAGLNKTTFPGIETFALLRYTSSGKLLSTTTASFFANGDSIPVAAAMQSNGDIVVAGTTTGTTAATEFALARFLPTGQLDTTFGQGGLVTTVPKGEFPEVAALLVQPDGRILVAGGAGSGLKKAPSPTVLVRYNPNGSLDSTFGTGGIVEEPTPVAVPTALALLSDGSYLAVSGTSSEQFSSTGVLQSIVPAETVGASNPSLPSSEAIVFQPNGDFV
jgi:uncharacterized delta-60 repeat protein